MSCDSGDGGPRKTVRAQVPRLTYHPQIWWNRQSRDSYCTLFGWPRITVYGALWGVPSSGTSPIGALGTFTHLCLGRFVTSHAERPREGGLDYITFCFHWDSAAVSLEATSSRDSSECGRGGNRTHPPFWHRSGVPIAETGVDDRHLMQDTHAGTPFLGQPSLYMPQKPGDRW